MLKKGKKMKKLLVAVLLLLSVNVAFSQKYEKKIAASDKNIEDPKKGINPNTWISRGELFYEIAAVPSELISQGMSEEAYELVMAGLSATATEQKETIGDKQYKVHVFDDKKVYIENGLIQFWDVLVYETPNPMQKAYEAYIKAKSLDTGGKKAKKLKENFSLLATLSKIEALNKFYLKQFADAVDFFALTADCSYEAGVIDTISIYYAGVLAATDVKNYEAAEKYLKKSIELGNTEKGDAYAYLAETLKALNKIEEARAILEKGFSENPENQQIVISLINNYMSTGKDPKDIIPLIKVAQEKEPTNINLHIVEGDLLVKLNDTVSAIKSYEKAIEVNPDDFFGYYKLGLLYFNTGANYSILSVDEKDLKESDRLYELANTELKRALPFLEKAFELKSDEESTIQALKEINFRFRNENDTYKQNAEKYSKLLENK
jgi:tetratricopeptide (TPR) repeat protein